MRESPQKRDLDRLNELVVEKFHGTFGEEQVAELSDLLSKSPELREEFWRGVALHARLQGSLGNGTTVANLPQKQAEISDTTSVSHGYRLPASLWALAVSACVLVAVTVATLVWNPFNGELNPGQAIAEGETGAGDGSVLGTLVPVTPDCTWTFGRSGSGNATSFRQGDTILLSEGAVELHFPSKTVALLESPAYMQLVASDRVRMLQGAMKVEVAKGDEGFTVETAAAEVIDLGTVFSVNVSDGNTDLVVFDGEVDLKVHEDGVRSSDSGDEKLTRFRAGEAVQVGSDGTMSRIVTVRQSHHRDENSTSHPERLIISEVNDNNIRDGFWSFYEIVPGGMKEDCQAFVDRHHEWNGARKSVIPVYLLGGDYVKTFNDDKVDDNLLIELTLAEPATLYVLLDERVSPPAWLLESFEATGDKIGVDETPHYPDRTTAPQREQQLSVGAGLSIDRNHSVWKKVVAEPGVISLGANGLLSQEAQEGVASKANMYGVVAVPLEDQAAEL